MTIYTVDAELSCFFVPTYINDIYLCGCTSNGVNIRHTGNGEHFLSIEHILNYIFMHHFLSRIYGESDKLVLLFVGTILHIGELEHGACGLYSIKHVLHMAQHFSQPQHFDHFTLENIPHPQQAILISF